MAKGIREKIKLVSSAGTGHFYTTTKNKRTKPEKLELKKFDPDLKYVKKWVPEYGSSRYPQPMVDHAQARERALRAFHKALKGKPS